MNPKILPGNITAFAVFSFVATIMIVIGIVQIKSKKPVGFYSGEIAPKEEDLVDVVSWNRKHGMMWIIYGVLIVLPFGIASFIGDSRWSVIHVIGGSVLPKR